MENQCPEFDANMSNYRSASVDKVVKVEKQILEELTLGNYVLAEFPPRVVSSLGAIPKDNNKIRLIHDLSRPRGGVNSFVEDSSVSYLTIDHATNFMKEGTFCAKRDLKSAYRSIPISPCNYPYTGLSWVFRDDNEKSFLYDTKLPFGSKKACKIFTCVSNAIARIMAKKGVRIVNYLDDFLIISDNKQKCWLDLDESINTLVKLGLDINWGKVAPPCQLITFLGVAIDTVNRTLSLPTQKLSELKDLVSVWLKKKRASKREILSLCGRLNWACRVVRGGRTFLRRLIDLSCRLKQHHHRIWLNSQAREDIQWWHFGLQQFHGYTKFISDMRPPDSQLVTDSCRISGGGLFEHDWFFVNFAVDYPKWKDEHINVLELLTILIAVRRWGHLWQHKHIRVNCDNSSSVSAINKGSSRSPAFMRILREIFWHSVKYDFKFSAVHIKGEFNVLADTISRLQFPGYFNKFACMFHPVSHINCFSHMSRNSFLCLQASMVK